MSPHIAVDEKKIRDFCEKWKVLEFSFFGSVLQDSFAPNSDIDILVEFISNPGWSLYDWIDMQKELEGMLGRKVDLVSKKGIRNPYRRESILNNREVVYAA